MNKYEKLVSKIKEKMTYAACPSFMGLKDSEELCNKKMQVGCEECWDKALEGIEEE